MFQHWYVVISAGGGHHRPGEPAARSGGERESNTRAEDPRRAPGQPLPDCQRTVASQRRRYR